MVLKIWKVSLDSGQWSSISHEFYIIDISESEAISNFFSQNLSYDPKNWMAFAKEVKFDGYVIDIYTEKEYHRKNKLDEIL